MFPTQSFMNTPRCPNNYIKVAIKSLHDVETFFHVATRRGTANIWSMELTLNANDFCDYRDDLLAMAFKRFQPHGARNPHNIYKIVIIVEGLVLFTRQTYTAVSPVASWDVDRQVEGLLTGRTTVRQKEELPFGVISQEKAFVAALLEIRGVHEVEVAGKMEPNLKKEIIANLKTKAGAPVHMAPPRDPLGVNGILWSTSYTRHRFDDMTYNPYAPKDKEGSEEASPTSRTRLRRRNSLQSANPYRIETLKRIAAKPQDADDYGSAKHAMSKKHYEYMDSSSDLEGRAGKDWLVPTGKGALCVMGWNAVGAFN